MQAFSIADMTFAVHLDRLTSDTLSSEDWLRVLTCHEPSFDLRLRRVGSQFMRIDDAELLFDSDTRWKIYGKGPKRIITISQSEEPEQAHLKCEFEPSDNKIDVLVSEHHGSSYYDPMESPLLEVLLLCLLQRGFGLMAHACGVVHDGKGYLFAGHSGDGKSTMAELWAPEATVLSDDRVVVRLIGDTFWIFGTPWRGTCPLTANQGAPLKSVFILSRADQNRADLLSREDGASALLARSFLPIWERAGMEFTLDLVDRLTAATPPYALGFVPDHRVKEFLLCLK